MKQERRMHSRFLTRLLLCAVLVVLVVFPAEAADWDGALKALQAGMKQEAQTIELEKYGIPADQFWDQYRSWVHQGKFPWYVKTGGQGWRNSKTGVFTKVEPNYLDKTKYSRTRYEQTVQKILNEVIDPDMSQWQRALALHDYIVTHCEYDQTPTEPKKHEGYDALVTGVAVCSGYARAYMDLMNRVGVPTVYVSSEGMDHGWNLVKIGSNWYHVDATWDDPSFNKKDVEGYCSHKYFLISDSTISDTEHEHYGWTKYYSCTDKTFETGVFWNDVNSPIVQPDTEFSFVSRSDYYNTKLYLRDSYTAKETLLFECKNPGGNGGYLYKSYGVSFDNGYVDCCDNQKVYAVSPDGKSAYTVYTNSSSGRVIVGCFVENGKLEVTTRDSGNNYQTTKVTISLPNGHKHIYTEYVVAPSCQEGYSQYSCSCGSSFYGGYRDPNGKHVPKGGYTVTVEPDFGVTGYKQAVCRNCGTRIMVELPDLNSVKWEFSDVGSGKFYYEPVLWAYSRGVTTGTASGVFEPDKTCTRAQVVTFLWRAMGEPEPSSSRNPFTDVKYGSFYYKAVLWAVEKGITTGTSATTFEPEASCTRAQVVTFLNRTAGNPRPSSRYSGFTDVSSGSFYYNSMLWAVENGITNGITATTFKPGDACTRGQIVTFLHRYLND